MLININSHHYSLDKYNVRNYFYCVSQDEEIFHKTMWAEECLVTNILTIYMHCDYVSCLPIVNWKNLKISAFGTNFLYYDDSRLCKRCFHK